MDLCPAIDVSGRRVTVMGLGRFGGGVGAVRFLSSRKARVTVTDLLGADELADPLARIADCAVETYHLGGHIESDFVDTDLVVVNPAVPLSSPFLERARDAGVRLTSEIALFWRFHPGRTLAVTGSNGKSTTTAMAHAMLRAAGLSCRLGGNIGHSLLPEVDEIAPHEWAVLELSSFQLEHLDRLPASPNVAVVTNFSPNHLDWHGCLAAYRRAKQAILRWQSPEDAAVLNQDDADVSDWATFGRTLWFGSHDLFAEREGIFERGADHVLRVNGREERFPLRDWVPLPGRHNLQNAMAAACAAMVAGADLDSVRRGLEAYRPLPHRLQRVAHIAGRTFYNDSLATTPESTMVALEAVPGPIVLLVGGYDKEIDLAPLAEAIARRVKAAALMGQTADALGCLLESNPESDRLAIQECDSFEEAFRWAVNQSEPGDTVLLSPACASYDWFPNYAERGRQFVEFVTAWQPAPAQG